MSRLSVALLCALAALVLGAPAAGQMFDKTNPQREIELGRQAAREVEREFPLSRNAANNQRVQRIGAALRASMDQRAYPYEFKVLAVPEFNAFCLPGGFMYVFDGLLTRLTDDDALAFVMAHEMVHASHRHWARIVDRMKPVTIAAILAGVATGQADAAALAQSIISAGYSREHETEADLVGQRLAWRAGYDPQGALDATAEMERLEKDARTPPEYLRSHPLPRDRSRRLAEGRDALRRMTRPAPAAPAAVDLRALVGDPPPGPYAPNPWYPLEVGRAWTYAVESRGARSSYTVTVASAIKTPGGEVYRIATALGRGSAVAAQVATDARTVWRRSRPAEQASPWQVEWLTPEPGSGAAEAGDATYAAERGETVATPGGAFADVLKVRKQAGGRTYEAWYARDVGLVKRVCLETGVTETLTSWKRPREAARP